MTQASNISDSTQSNETKDLLVKIFDRLLTMEKQIQEVRQEVRQEVKTAQQETEKQIQEVKTAQEETNKKVSAWDARLWALSLILIGAAMTAFITITLSVGSLAFKVLSQ